MKKKNTGPREDLWGTSHQHLLGSVTVARICNSNRGKLAPITINLNLRSHKSTLQNHWFYLSPSKQLFI